LPHLREFSENNEARPFRGLPFALSFQPSALSGFPPSAIGKNVSGTNNAAVTLCYLNLNKTCLYEFPSKLSAKAGGFGNSVSVTVA
jgi:hypothetical protein